MMFNLSLKILKALISKSIRKLVKRVDSKSHLQMRYVLVSVSRVFEKYNDISQPHVALPK